MSFLLFIKEIFLENKNSLLRFWRQQSLPEETRLEVERKIASTNVKRLIPFAALILLIEIINQITLFASQTYPSLHVVYLAAGLSLVALSAVTLFLSYRTLNAAPVSVRRCRRLNRAFWFFFSINMLGFIYLEISTRGLTNNFFYLLILTAAFPLLSTAEALWFFGMDLAVSFPIAVCNGFTAQQLIQLPLVAFSR